MDETPRVRSADCDIASASPSANPAHDRNTDIARPLGFVLHGSLRRREVRVFQLAVDPDVRGLGIARRLLAALLRRCRRSGSFGVSLRCREELAANRFWHRAGFELHDLESGRRGALYVWVRRLLGMKRATHDELGHRFHSRWHRCPGCGQHTCGSWTSKGVRLGVCDACVQE
ncbi:GNAT family N-acetyltransferase [Humisphaera borealis]|uniref:GNAT family N-acetyltransferase n=1 Tax=Humisphaera borealis TaxID=2807512 RepID=A0A7M2X245_9BACT|nr:GNAT family N-acetyltransferase [Humisphaera borealis]